MVRSLPLFFGGVLASKHLILGHITSLKLRSSSFFWCPQAKPSSFLGFVSCFKSTMEPWFIFPWNLSYQFTCNIFISIQWSPSQNFIQKLWSFVSSRFQESLSSSSSSAAQVMVRKRYDRHAKASSKEQAVVIAASELNRLRALGWNGWNGWVKTPISVSWWSWCEYMS